jgi:PAS domain S-box-containing protein
VSLPRVLVAPADFARIIDTFPVAAIVVLDATGDTVLVNDALRRTIGIDPQKPIRRSITFFQFGAVLAGDEDPLARTLVGDDIGSMQVEVRGPDGALRSAVLSTVPLRGDGGSVTGAFAVLHDVDEHMHAGRALAELTMHTPALLFTADAGGSFDSINARWNEFIGEAADELLGTGWKRFIHPDDATRVAAEWSRNVASGEPYNGQWRFLRNDGTYRWTEIRAEARRDERGNVRRWFGSGTDVDAQRRALEALDFLAETGETVAGALNDVTALLDQLAKASLEGLADISIFDVVEEDGRFRRLVVASPRARRSAVEITGAFDPPAPNDLNPIARAIHDGQTIHVPYVDEAFILSHISPPARRAAWRFVDIRSIVCAPMTSSGRGLGALTLLRTGTSVPFETSDMKVIQEVARRAAVAVENLRLKERERREARNLRAFADMGEALGESLGLQKTLDAAMHVIVPERADWGFVNLIDEHGDLRLAAVFHSDPAKGRDLLAHVGKVYARGDNPEGSPAVARTRSAVLIDHIDYESAARIVSGDLLESFSRMDLARVVIVPLYSSLAVRGTLHLCSNLGGRVFTASDVEFFQELARRMAPAIANAELFERERRVARSFQDAALPTSLPDVPGFTFHAIYEAGKAEASIGGDWYDAFSLPDGRIVISIGDVAGSGLSAAVTMSSVRQAIRGAAHVHADPSVMLEAANHAVLEDAERRFVTAFVGVIEPGPSAAISYQSAGHPAPILWSPDGILQELLGHGPPLGLGVERSRQNLRCALPVGSLLSLFTDGLIESTHNVLEGEARVREALLDSAVHAAANPAQMLHDAVLVDGSRDDVAILTIKTIGEPSP